MTVIGAFEAKNSLGALLDRAEAGEEIVITRHGKPVARLVGVTDEDKKARALAAAEGLRRLKAEIGGPAFTVAELLAMRDEGRR